MSILITGARGFIGQATTRVFDAEHVPWTPFEGDILDAAAFDAYEHCDAVLHLAGITRTDNTPEAQARLMEVNLNGTLNALRFAGRGGRRFLFASTCSYGNPGVFPTPESTPLTYFEPYSFSKWAAEKLIEAWTSFLGSDAVVLRIFNVYGPGQPTRFLIPDIVKMVQGGAVNLRNLTAVRDFIYVDDLARLFVAIVKNPAPGLHTVNAGSGTGADVGQVLRLVLELSGTAPPVTDRGQPETVPMSVADVTKARRDFGWSPATTLREGLRAVLRHENLLASGEEGAA